MPIVPGMRPSNAGRSCSPRFPRTRQSVAFIAEEVGTVALALGNGRALARCSAELDTPRLPPASVATPCQSIGTASLSCCRNARTPKRPLSRRAQSGWRPRQHRPCVFALRDGQARLYATMVCARIRAPGRDGARQLCDVEPLPNGAFSPLEGLTGIDDPYEPPDEPDVEIDTVDIRPDLAVRRVFLRLESLGFIGRRHHGRVTP